MAKSTAVLGFNEALAYLIKLGHPLSAYSMRRELAKYPERFGAMRRNPLAKRGRGGRYYFTKEKLDQYTSLTEA